MTREIRIGTSGWVYQPWRGPFYPKTLPQREELAYLAQRLGSAEINASFYSLQRPEYYQHWASQVPRDFVFALKGGRFITHMKKLRDACGPLANFFASGVLALGHKLGPILWQLPPSLHYDPDRLTAFFELLPRDMKAAASLASEHDSRLDGRALTSTDTGGHLRHAIEVRHSSYATEEFVQLLRAHDIGLVVADAPGDWPHLEDVTSDFVYIRLHGNEELYSSGYSSTALDGWAGLIRQWHAGQCPRTEFTVAEPGKKRTRGRDVFAYFDNDVKAHAPSDALALADRLGTGPPQ